MSNGKRNRKSDLTLASLIEKYKRNSVASEIEKNLTSQARVLYPVNQLSLFELYDEENYDLSLFESLEASLRKDGFLLPLVLSKDPKKPNHYFILNGAKRFLIAKNRLGMATLPCILSSLTPERERAYVLENIVAEGGCCLAKTYCFQTLVSKYHVSLPEIEGETGISDSEVRNLLRLDSLPSDLKKDLQAGKMTYGEARVFLGLPYRKQLALREKLFKDALSVRELEGIKRNYQGKNRKVSLKLEKNTVSLSFEDEEDAKKAYRKLLEKYSRS